MASAESSDDTWCGRGRGRQSPILGSSRARHRSESRRLSDRHPVKAVPRKHDQYQGFLHAGDAVRIFSRTADVWVDGEVAEFVEDNFIRVEYRAGGYWYGKTLHLHSQHLAIPSTTAAKQCVRLPQDRWSGSGEYLKGHPKKYQDFHSMLYEA